MRLAAPFTFGGGGGGGSEHNIDLCVHTNLGSVYTYNSLGTNIYERNKAEDLSNLVEKRRKRHEVRRGILSQVSIGSITTVHSFTKAHSL